MNQHLDDNELLDHLYGLGENGEHLETCSDCARRWRALYGQRARIVAPEEIPMDLLAAQRRKIYSRLGERPHKPLKWVPALAAAGLLAAGLFIYRPVVYQPPQASHPDIADAQLFSDVYNLEQSTEPLAAAPIHALFEDNQ